MGTEEDQSPTDTKKKWKKTISSIYICGYWCVTSHPVLNKV